MKLVLFNLANRLYKRAYLFYRPLYSMYKGISDREERGILRGLLQPGMTAIDVGANIGIYACFLAKLVGEQGRIIAFEPEPRNFERLAANVADMRSVEPVHAAVTDHSGDVTLFLSDSLNVDHQTYDNGEMRRRATVPAVSLDDHFAPGTHIDLVKIDVQGYEYHVLQGARRVLQENPNIVLLMEFWPYGLQKAGVEPNVLLDLIAAMGFSSRPTNSALGSSFRPDLLDRQCEDQYCNLLLTRSADSPQSRTA